MWPYTITTTWHSFISCTVLTCTFSTIMLKVVLMWSCSILLYWHFRCTNNGRHTLHAWLDKTYRAPGVSMIKCDREPLNGTIEYNRNIKYKAPHRLVCVSLKMHEGVVRAVTMRRLAHAVSCWWELVSWHSYYYTHNNEKSEPVWQLK